VKTGGCVCGAVRYEAFAVWPTFSHPDVKLTGALKAYEHRSDESGRWIRLNFCPRCGTTVTSTFEMEQGQVSVLGGTFDDTGWIKVDRHVWTRSKQHWFSVPGGVTAFEKSSRT
jgi:hypothetical protein